MPREDRAGLRVAAALLSDRTLDLAKPTPVAEALGMDRTTVFECRNSSKKGRGRGPTEQKAGPAGLTSSRANAQLAQERKTLLDCIRMIA